MMKIKIQYCMFDMAFSRDFHYQNPCNQTGYLDLTSGEMLWLHDSDQIAEREGFSAKENKQTRALIKARPKNFLQIDGLSHGAHHNILQDFLASPWTDDKSQHQAAAGVYYGRKSIKGWLKNVQDDAAVEGYLRYKDKRIDELGCEFLRRHEIEPEWL